MKNIICIITGILGAAVTALFGGWTEALMLLGILMIIDYVSGLVVAGIFHRSPKSAHGGLESHAGLKGLMRKIFVLALVAVAHFVDRLIGVNYVRDAAALAFSLNEILSIVENAGLMGIPMPKALKKAIDVLRDKAGENEEAEKPPDEGDRETEPAAPRNDTEMTSGEIGGQIARATEDDGASWTPPHTEEDGKC